jgi:hypothetical protein
MTRRILLLALFASAGLGSAQPRPDFTGKWRLDTSKSDDASQAILRSWGDPNRMSPTDRRTADRLIQLASALQQFEIRQTERDISLYDDAGNVRIYYLDEKKHTRETPWGDKLQTESKWQGSELQVKTDGKDLGEVNEAYAKDGSALLYTITLKMKHSKEPVVIRSYFAPAAK